MGPKFGPHVISGILTSHNSPLQLHLVHHYNSTIWGGGELSLMLSSTVAHFMLTQNNFMLYGIIVSSYYVVPL